jgi:RNA polymerase sigma factor (sigma-70 family)
MTSDTPDQDLVKAYAADGSEAAFRALARRHVDLVFATALRQLGDRGMAEEVTQNVFVVLARKAPRLAGTHTLACWLHRTTILEAKARIRAELRRRRREEAMVELSSLQQEGTATLQALVPLLDEGLLNLREKDRHTLVLRFLEQRSLREVGNALGVDEDAARKRVARALNRLSDFFRARGFTVSAGAGTAALFASSTQAAPVGLALAAANAGLASGGAASGLNLLLLKWLSLSKAQLAAACLVLAAVPFAWQHQAFARADADREQLAGQLTADQRRISELDAETQRASDQNARRQADLLAMENRLALLEAQLQGRIKRTAYHWDDNSPVARVPKALVQMLDLAAVANKRGQLSDGIKEVLQLTGSEQQKLQAALDRFLADYYAAQASKVRQVTPEADDLRGQKPEDTRVFAVTALGELVGRLRDALFAEAAETLGPQRFPIFRLALSDWMPLTDDPYGFNSFTVIFNFDHRIRFSKPKPGMDWLLWGIGKSNGEEMSASINIEDIPPNLLPYLQDWIAIARSQSAAHQDPKPQNP